ncbi:hypothetical protein PAXRUDRAFT_827341 [Paxillus rubicundulus Ve08.2h10]|uniref:BAG domain-containing protein n=1 Tax=Paxillus rubicundulus Ve08.2h10 TaxID=930991 RepID=A0A0D0DQY1_9AGAM|nr:hypothetical protein PAXRUDRAFT_827341 [Paxillus rubicundulus Ve08.2h10]
MIRVKWGRDVLHFPVPPPNTPLGKLRADLAEYTHLPPTSFKLIHAGAVMKDDSAPLSAYKIRENSTIALIGGHLIPETPSTITVPRPAPPKQKAPQTEESTVSAIRAELDRVRSTLVPDVHAFVIALPHLHPAAESTTLAAPSMPASGTSPTPDISSTSDLSSSPKPSSLEHTRLSELLLQSLLRLDALHMSGADWPEARQQRKAAVREVQGILDRLDGAWAAR